jgi:polysaccharide export outer membrane protein
MMHFQSKDILQGIGFFALLFLISCANPKKLRYFQTKDNERLIVDSVAYTLPKIQPNDVVSVDVFALDPDVVRPFNQQGGVSSGASEAIRGLPAVSENTSSKGYLVDVDGFIDFPVLGKINISGQNRIQVSDVIRERLLPYVNNPRVNVSIMNHKVTMLGEIGSPGVYPISSDRLTLDEAIAMAGDLTTIAVLDNIRVIRETNGKKIEYRVNIKSPDFFRSPVYFLQNNDLIYVEVNSNGAVQANIAATQTRATVLMSINFVINLSFFISRIFN